MKPNEPLKRRLFWGPRPLMSRLGISIFLWFLTISLLPLAIVSVHLGLKTNETLTTNAKDSLTETMATKKNAIEGFFEERIRDLQVQSELRANIDFLIALDEAFRASNMPAADFVLTTEWTELTLEGSADLRNFQQTYGYLDAFLINRDGTILFSIMGGDDMGANLLDEPYKDTQFAEAWRRARNTKAPTCSDLEVYEPTWDELAMFLCKRLENQNSQVVGVLAIQLPINQIKKVMKRRSTDFETLDAYLVGEDLLMRTQSLHEKENTILERKVTSEATRGWMFEAESARIEGIADVEEREEALQQLEASGTGLPMGESGFYLDHQDHEVLGAYSELDKLEKWGLNWIVVAEIDKKEALADLRNLIKVTAIALLFLVFCVLFASLVITNRIVGPIRHISRRAKQAAIGNLQTARFLMPRNEIGELAESFHKVIISLQDVTEVCKAIALGDFTRTVVVRSEYDVLGQAVNQMGDTLREVVAQAEGIAKGDYSSVITPKSDKDELSLALSNMTTVLSRLRSEKNRQDWQTNGEVQLRDQMQGDLDLTSLGRNIIQFVCKYLNGQVGAFYILGEDDILRLIASYAYRKRKEVSNAFGLGHGIVGQAALERETILITHVPPDYVQVFSGIGSAPPRAILAVPFLFEDEVVGVLELGSFEEFTDEQIKLLEKLREYIGIAVNTATARARMAELLRQTRDQADTLQTQQDELKKANSELEEQTRALRESEAALQAGQEELRSTNEELEEQTRALRESQARLQEQQSELQQINEELEERSQALERQRDEVRHKNAELERARQELAQKARDLTQTSKYKSEFLANMSHELRTPLNSMLILSQLLEKNEAGNLSDKQVSFAKTIYQSGSDLLALINEILDLSKVEAGKMDLHLTAVPLQKMSEALERKFRPVAEEKGLTFQSRIDPDLPNTIVTDDQRAEQILRNLLSNAIKFTQKGEVGVRFYRPKRDDLSPETRLDPRRTVAISVTDTGLGIPSDKRALIFEAFQQADGTTSRHFGGTGLGLSISRELARLLRGEIKLESEESSGSVFTLFLPEHHGDIAGEEQIVLPYHPEKPPISEPLPKPVLKEPGEEIVANPAGNPEPNPSTPPTESPAPASAPQGNPSPPPTDEVEDDRHNLRRGDPVLLIIEDDPGFQKTLMHLARERGFKCLLAGDGESGLHKADYYKPDAILLDIGLPRMDGMAVMSRLKDNPETRHIPVHFISGADRNFEAMKMGAAGFLKKPATMADMDQAFNRISHIISRPIKHLLIVEDDVKLRSSLLALTGGKDVEVVGVGSASEAIKLLQDSHYDCMVLDVNLPDISGYDLLSQIRNDSRIPHLPIIVYTGKDLTEEEKVKLDQYAESVVFKTANSAERLLDETILFLHRVESELGGEQRRLLNLVHDKESIFRDKNILIVDDDMRNVFALSSVLEEKGMNVIVGTNGRDGIEKLEASPDIDLVLMDIMMPEMDGYEAIREIRKQAKYRKLPIIALTAKAMKGDRHKCIDAGANDYMAKPVDNVKLLSLMRVWLY